MPLFAACVPVPVARSSATLPGPSPALVPTPTAAPTPIPTPTGPTPVPSFVRPTLTPEPSFTVYVVARGDTLISIARRFETTTQSLAFWNRATYPSLDPDSATYAPDRIKIGWRLRLHPGTEVDPDALLEPSSPSPASPSASPSPS
jgi:hypothetical protein